MIITNNRTLEKPVVAMEGAKDVRMRILIGPDHGSARMTMRLLLVMPESHTAYHTHDFEHVVRVISGKGQVVDAEGEKHELSVGQSVFVGPGEKHLFAC